MDVLNRETLKSEAVKIARTFRDVSIAASFALSFGLALVSSTVLAGPYDIKGPTEKALEEAKKRLCPATEEYIKTLTFLRETREFKFQEEVSRTIADRVSKGCDGASERFAQILILFKTVGFSETKSIEMALEFASTSPDVQKNFLEIFTKSFLREFFDYEATKAIRLGLELSKEYKGDPAIAREDFIELARFCKDSKNLGLPISFCAEYAVQIAKLSQFHENGVSQLFREVFTRLRTKKEFSLDIKVALEFAYGILKSGPKASENFFSAFDFASGDLKMPKDKALKFALHLAGHSYIGETPPVLQFPSIKQESP